MHVLKDALYRLASVRTPRNCASILTYHSISTAAHFGAVTPDNFAAQMQALKEHGFNVISLDELARMRKTGHIAPKTVCITFDDGYRDNFTVAYPILKRHGFPATIFVITDAIGTTWETRGETFQMLSEAEIREMEGSGLISIEPHTASHKKLHQLYEDESDREVRESKEKLDSLLQKKCAHFAYPKGRNNDIARESVRRADISYAYTTEEGLVRPGDDDLTLKRNGINRTVTLQQYMGTALWGRLSRARLLKI